MHIMCMCMNASHTYTSVTPKCSLSVCSRAARRAAGRRGAARPLSARAAERARAPAGSGTRRAVSAGSMPVVGDAIESEAIIIVPREGLETHSMALLASALLTMALLTARGEQCAAVRGVRRLERSVARGAPSRYTISTLWYTLYDATYYYGAHSSTMSCDHTWTWYAN